MLRIEDHDRGRSRAAWEAAILADLAWLGLEPEPESRGSLGSGGPSPFRQSDNDARYRAAVERLARRTAVYACECSRRDVVRAVGGVEPGEEPAYPGTCREKGLSPGPGLGLRAVLPPDRIVFEDLRLGRLEHHPATQCGDLLLRDGLGNWTYQLAVVVDDLAHGIDLVVRGEDLLGSTGRQILLGRLLGRERPPAFLHHPLVRNEAGVKLSKKDGATGLAALRAEGRTPAEVLGRAAYRSGLVPEPRPVEVASLGDLFRPGP